MDRFEQKILSIIEENSEKICDIGRDIFTHAELGFKEKRTSALAAEWFKALGMEPQTGLAVTGVKSLLKKESNGPIIALVGEMDALPIPQHPDANPETGASHCCGHNAQMAGLLGSAIALSDPEIKAALGGNIAFMAVPSEEFVETEFKLDLIHKGVIGYSGGKSELIRVGAFDDISVVVGHHTSPGIPGYQLANNSTNGFFNKVVTFHGKSSHAASAADKGINALNAAQLALHAIDLQRETFRDQDAVRIHGYLPRAGTAMNVIAEEVCIESSVRAKNIQAILDASKKYDRSMRAGAMALGCSAEIVTIPGYLPTIPLKDTSLMAGVLEDLSTEEKKKGYDYPVLYHGSEFHSGGSTDYGEVSALLPLFQFNTGGYSGQLHNSNIRVTDEKLAYVETAKIFALMAYRLLRNGAAEAEKVISGFSPTLTKEEYFKYMNENDRTEIFSENKK